VHPAVLVAVAQLVAGLPRNPEFLAQRGHPLAAMTLKALTPSPSVAELIPTLLGELTA
jgi:hypothetical protein